MDPAIFFTLLLSLLTFFSLITIATTRRWSSPSKNLPPGSLGFPLLGQSLQFLRAMRANTAERWLEDRIRRYGPVSKMNLFGTPTIFIAGPSANKLMFTGDSETLSNEQPASINRILGERNLLALRGEDHRRVRGALLTFLKPEVLKEYAGKMDEEVRKHIDRYWRGQQMVKVLPLMKALTFDIMCSLQFGIKPGPQREKLVNGFQDMILGMWSVPVNFPFTRFNRSLRAGHQVRKMVEKLIRERRLALEQGLTSPRADLITWLLTIQKEAGEEQMLTDEEIVHSVVIVMVAGHDTSSVVMTFLIRLLANDPKVYESVVQEQQEVAMSKAAGEALTWEDLSKMKYTWRATMELLRVTPPVFGGFRQVLKDIEYNGYLIPKGWQIFWTAWATHMDEGLFPNPSKFDPSRFQNKVTPYSFVPFGGGPRICPGNEFARLEILTTIHHLVTNFKWQLCCKEDTFKRDPMPVPNQDLPILLQPKKGNAAL